MHGSHPVARRRALRTIAVFEALKGATALAASLGLLSLLHHDLHQLAVALIGHFGLNPGDHYPAIILRDATLLQDTNLRSLLMLATGYVLVRFSEAYGLWHQRRWGEWLGALSSGLYVPFELRHLLYHPSAASAAVVVINVLVVAFLVWQLVQARRADSVAPR
ncbi:TmRNA [Burkholderiales bacterium]|nr:TmRNA [Burkholderiales bacterium]